LAGAISLLIKDRELRNKMGEAARKKMNEESNLIHQQVKIEEFYRHILNSQL
jgi:hypothetical protein